MRKRRCGGKRGGSPVCADPPRRPWEHSNRLWRLGRNRRIPTKSRARSARVLFSHVQLGRAPWNRSPRRRSPEARVGRRSHWERARPRAYAGDGLDRRPGAAHVAVDLFRPAAVTRPVRVPARLRAAPGGVRADAGRIRPGGSRRSGPAAGLSLIRIPEPTTLGMQSYASFCLKKNMRNYLSQSPVCTHSTSWRLRDSHTFLSH